MNVTLPVFPLALSAGELMPMAPPVQTVLHSCLIYDLSRLAGRLLYCCLFTFPGRVNDDFFFVRSKCLISFWFFLLCMLMPYFVWAKTSAFGFVICKWFLPLLPWLCVSGALNPQPFDHIYTSPLWCNVYNSGQSSLSVTQKVLVSLSVGNVFCQPFSPHWFSVTGNHCMLWSSGKWRALQQGGNRKYLKS